MIDDEQIFRDADHCAGTHPTTQVGVFTLVLWLVCLIVGALGFTLPYARTRAPLPPEEPVLTQQLEVQLTPDTASPETQLSPLDPLAPPPPPEAMTPPPMIQPIAVAQPSPAVAFALPVEGPARIVETKRAEYVRPTLKNTPSTQTSAPSGIAAQSLVFGEGEGKQPAPPYPPQARKQGQEGTVVVRLAVGEDGRVLSANAFVPSPWPLLNAAAERTVQERWKFHPGPARIYDVAIRFELIK